MDDLEKPPNASYLFEDLAERDPSVHLVLSYLKSGTITYEQALLYIIKVMDSRQVIYMQTILELKEKQALVSWVNKDDTIM